MGGALLSGHLGLRRRRYYRTRELETTTQSMSGDELLEYLVCSYNSDPAWVDWARHMREWRLSRLTWNTRMMVQLAHQGWCEQDAWSLDRVLCTRLAGQLESLADQLHGWPESEEFPAPEDWEHALRETASSLRRVHGSPETKTARSEWLTYLDDEAQAEPYYERYAALEEADSQAVSRALHWVAEHHQHLWD